MSEPSDQNKWVGSGRVLQPVKRGTLGSGDKVCSFQVQILDSRKRKTWVRVNVYQLELVQYAQDNVSRGCYVHVEGGLMNRKRALKSPQLTEVRATSILVDPKEQGRRKHGKVKAD